MTTVSGMIHTTFYSCNKYCNFVSWIIYCFLKLPYLMYYFFSLKLYILLLFAIITTVTLFTAVINTVVM